MSRLLGRMACLALWAACGAPALNAVEVESVTVGNAGNAGELSGAGAGGFGPDRVCGAVGYAYRIGKYEITNGQYIEFLNSVATTDTFGLYHAGMSGSFGGIARTGTPGSYFYAPKDGDPAWLTRPVNYVNFWDAARFANWLHNGQPVGPQNADTTEDGAYTLLGYVGSGGAQIGRNPGALVFIPSEDEWYKAAYYDPALGGRTGGYWTYSLRADAPPTPELPPGTNLQAGSANYWTGQYTLGAPYYTTERGAYSTRPCDSPYGTFDQGGNMWEWVETCASGSAYRGLRGGSFYAWLSRMDGAYRVHGIPTLEDQERGFRVAFVARKGELAIPTVPVGNAGNTGELSGSGAGGLGPDRVCGAVGHVYSIGTCEVTAGEYTAFLNAVASSDPYALYNPQMWNHSAGCRIRRDGVQGSFVYSVEPEWADRPVNYVCWGDAARFANWLHNGQPTGSQNLGTTEDGSYHLAGATGNAALLAIIREPDATWVVPSEDEWHKAAYHKNDGVTGNYWDFPTATDAPPSNDLLWPDPGNNANFDDNGYTIGAPFYRTEAADFENSESAYGTFDQGGNVWEWTEAIIHGSYRGFRGGSFFFPRLFLQANVRDGGYLPSYEDYTYGFRVVRVPRRGDLNCDGEVDFGDINPFVKILADPSGWRIEFPGCDFLNGDINEDASVNFADINPFVALLTSP